MNEPETPSFTLADSQQLVRTMVDADEAARNSDLHIGWNKTLQDLNDDIASGARPFITGHEGELAVRYEVSLLPADTRFPKTGEVYQAIEDCAIAHGRIYAGRLPNETTLLLAGEQIRVDVAESNPLAVVCTALNNDTLAARITDDDEREDFLARDYYLTVHTADINKAFQFVE